MKLHDDTMKVQDECVNRFLYWFCVWPNGRSNRWWYII